MEYEFDPAKDAANLQKHGLPLGDAALLDWGGAITFPDTRFDYGEARMVALALLGQRLHTVVYVDRTGVRRVISLRKSKKQEVQLYVAHTQAKS